MTENKYFLGIDTSNYTTSVAITDIYGNIVSDRRKILSVNKGERGLRQQNALFQHIVNLPDLIEMTMDDIGDNTIEAICVSQKPRDVEGSYMPCFNAGVSVARCISSSNRIPIYFTDHQNGHLKAASWGTEFEKKDAFIFCHLSGGTCEIISIDNENFKICGGSLDISFGQLLDRTGVLLGLDFPCGRYLDETACKTKKITSLLTEVKCKDGWFNLSGTETQIIKAVNDGNDSDMLIAEIFEKISLCLSKTVIQICERENKYDVLFAGGVASSNYLRASMSKFLKDINFCFGNSRLCSDNAVGVSLIGGKQWLQNR